ATPWRAAACETASMSTGYGSRLRSRRPVGGPSTSTNGFSSARSRRSGICWRAWLKPQGNEASPGTGAARQSSGRSGGSASARAGAGDAAAPAAAAGGPAGPAEGGGGGARPPFVEAIGHRDGLAVLRDCDVLEARGSGCRGHCRQVVVAVALGRVHVQVAPQ